MISKSMLEEMIKRIPKASEKPKPPKEKKEEKKTSK